MYNYWTEKINLKAEIAKTLMPKLKVYIGQEVKTDTVILINATVMDWLDDIGEVMFTCEININIETKDGKRLVNGIAVMPLDD